MRRFLYAACVGLGCLVLMSWRAGAAGAPEAELPLAPVPAGPAVSATPFLDDQAPPVEDLVREALANNPSVSVMTSRIHAAEEMTAPEGALPDPMVEFELTDVNFPSLTVGDEEMSMAGVRISQGLLFPGKLKARREAARAVAPVRAAELEEVRRRLVSQVRMVYARLYAIDQERQALELGRELLDMLTATVSMRYSAGETEQEALIKAQLQLSRLGERQTDLESERRVLNAALNRLLGRGDPVTLGKVDTLPESALPEPAWESQALANAAEIRIKEKEVTVAERKVDAARADLNPGFTVGAGVFSRGGFDHIVTLQVGIELPLWKNYKQKPLLRAAEQERDMARHELREAEIATRSEIERLAAEWAKAGRQIQLYTEGIIPQTSAALDAARSSYLVGRGDFSTVIEDFNLWLEARVELGRREADRFITWAEIEYLIRPSPAARDGELRSLNGETRP
ncbi:MAG: TolC family protein [bacterium]